MAEHSEFALPRVSIERPEKPTTPESGATAAVYELARIAKAYSPEAFKLVSGENARLNYEHKVKESEVKGVANIVYNSEGSPAMLPIIMREGGNLVSQMVDLRKTNKIDDQTFANLLEPITKVYMPTQEGSTTSLLTTIGDSTYKLTARQEFDQNSSKGQLEYQLSKDEGPFRGSIKLAIPISYPETGLTLDAVSARIHDSDGILGQMNFHETVDLIVNVANSAAYDFESVVAEARSKISNIPNNS